MPATAPFAVLVFPRAGRVVGETAEVVHREDILRLAPLREVGVLSATQLERGVPRLGPWVEAREAGLAATLAEA